MKPLTTPENTQDHQRTSLTQRCLGRCRELIDQVKQSVRQHFQPGTTGERRVLELALNEAESLAFQTPFPQLIFPALAEEKVAAASRWSSHQRTVRQMRTDALRPD
jgi:hypothetical protein